MYVERDSKKYWERDCPRKRDRTERNEEEGNAGETKNEMGGGGGQCPTML